MIRIAFLFAAFFFSILCSGQQYNFISYRTNNGLIQSDVTALEQDEKGRIWIGTVSGISVYSGSSFKGYGSSQNLAEEWVTAVYSDPENGNVWVGHFGGTISHFNILSEKFQILNTRNLLDNTQINCFYSNSSNKLFIGTNGNGIFSLLRDSLTIQRETNYPSNWEVFEFLQAGDKFYIATSKGLFVENNSGERQRIIDEKILKVTTNINGEIIALTLNKVIKVSANLSTQILFEDRESQFTSVTCDKQNRIWIGTENGTAIRLGKQIIRFRKQNGLNLPEISKIFCDNENNIWIGGTIGLELYQGEKFVRLDESIIGGNLVWDIAITSNRIYTASKSGLSIIHKDNLSSGQLYEKLQRLEVKCLLTIKDDVYIGTTSGIVYKLDKNGTLTEISTFSTPITDLVESQVGIFIGTESGLYDFNFTNYSLDSISINSDKNPLVLSLYRNKTKGEIWVSTWDGGAYVSKNGIDFSRPNWMDPIASAFIFSMTSSPNGEMYFGTYGKGIHYKREDSLVPIGVRSRLNNTTAYALLFSNDSLLWVGTNNGIVVYNLINNGSWRLSNNQGFTGIEVNQNAMIKDEIGNIYLGTLLGLEIYRPSKEYKLEFNPTMEFTKLLSGNKEIFFPPDSIFSAIDNNLTFNFESYSPGYGNDIHYFAQLEPLEKEFKSIKKSKSVTYTGLRPGKYLIKIKAVLEGHSQKILSYRFKIEVPFYEKSWFYFAQFGVLLLMFLTAAFYGRKTKGSRIATMVATVAVIILFEWVLNLIEANVEEYARGIAFIKITMNVLMALALFPIEHYLKRFLVKH